MAPKARETVKCCLLGALDQEVRDAAPLGEHGYTLKNAMAADLFSHIAPMRIR